MEAATFPETLVPFYLTTPRHIQEESNMNIYSYQNLKSHTFLSFDVYPIFKTRIVPARTCWIE
jgi:hypothetical protein